MGGGLGSRCVGGVYGADGAVRTIHTTYAATWFKLAQSVPIKYTEATKKRVEFSVEASHRFRIQI